MSDMLPRLFFQHFRDSSFVAVDESRKAPIAGFLVGFVSPAEPVVAYVHFIGVAPTHRKAGVARALYERFFAHARDKGCRVVRCITSPVNTQSIAFHRHLGFMIEKGDSESGDGVSVHVDYDGPGQSRVCFQKALSSALLESDLVAPNKP